MTAALSTPLFCTRSSVESVRGSATFAGAADAARAACAPEAVKAPDSVAAPINAVEAKACLRFMRPPWWLDAAGPTGAGLRRAVPICASAPCASRAEYRSEFSVLHRLVFSKWYDARPLSGAPDGPRFCPSANPPGRRPRCSRHLRPHAMTRHVVIIGAGVVGAVSVIEARRSGLRVTLVEAGPAGGEQAASYGNAGWLSSHSVIAPAEPGLWKKLPGFVLDPLGPLAIRMRYLPQVEPWLFG